MMMQQRNGLETLSLDVSDQKDYKDVKHRVSEWNGQKKRKYSFPLLIRTGHCLTTEEVADFDNQTEISGTAIDAYLSLLAEVAPNVSFVGTEQSMAFFSSNRDSQNFKEEWSLQFMESNTPDKEQVQYVVATGNKKDHFVTFVLVKSETSNVVTILDSLFPNGTSTEEISGILQKKLAQKTFEQYLQESIGTDESFQPIKLAGIEQQVNRMCGVWTCHFAHQVATHGLEELKNIDVKKLTKDRQIKLKTPFANLLNERKKSEQERVFTRLLDILIQNSVSERDMVRFFQKEIDSMLRGDWKPLVSRSWQKILQSECASFFINHMIQEVMKKKKGLSIFLSLIAAFRDSMPSLLVFVWHNRFVNAAGSQNREYTDGWKDLDGCWSQQYGRPSLSVYSQLYRFIWGKFSALLQWKYSPPLVKQAIIPFARLLYDFLLCTLEGNNSANEVEKPQIADFSRCLLTLERDFLQGNENAGPVLELQGFPSDQKKIEEFEQKIIAEQKKKEEDAARQKTDEKKKNTLGKVTRKKKKYLNRSLNIVDLSAFM